MSTDSEVPAETLPDVLTRIFTDQRFLPNSEMWAEYLGSSTTVLASFRAGTTVPTASQFLRIRFLIRACILSSDPLMRSFETVLKQPIESLEILPTEVSHKLRGFPTLEHYIAAERMHELSVSLRALSLEGQEAFYEHAKEWFENLRLRAAEVPHKEVRVPGYALSASPEEIAEFERMIRGHPVGPLPPEYEGKDPLEVWLS
ncbi:MAG: hypothetical protein JWN50_104 [Parcubacteria group bacterium]|nr:hypothetical protein [Parcubacteria group bacterium]